MRTDDEIRLARITAILVSAGASADDIRWLTGLYRRATANTNRQEEG